jgi:hypothetical protein
VTRPTHALGRAGLLQSAVTSPEAQLRTVISGVRVEGPGAPRDVHVGEAGAFLLLYDGRVAANEVRVTPR